MQEPDQKTIVKPVTDASQFVGTHSCSTCGFVLPKTVVICPKDGTKLVSPITSGVLLGKYEFVDVVGSGGMGIIYKARHPVLNRMVAIKMLHPHLLSEAIIKRFEQEALAISSLSHPNIIQVYDYGISEHGQPYMVMDFVEGETLSDVLRRMIVGIEPALNIFIQVCDALQHAHDKNVLHRDLKPSNIMVMDVDCSFPEIKIVDFGIAKVLEADKTRVTLTGELMGTPHYMSPEQCRGLELDRRSDIYSLGCVMFEALTGRLPFGRSTAVATIVEQITAMAPPLSEVRPDIIFPQLLEEVIAKALAKDPDARYQSMSALMNDLLRVQQAYLRTKDTKQKSYRFRRLSREQTVFALLSAAVLLSVAFSVISLSDSLQNFRIKEDSQEVKDIAPSAPPPASQYLPMQERSIRLAERAMWFGDINHDKIDDQFIRNYFQDNLGLRSLDLAKTKITNNALLSISNQTSVKAIVLSRTSISDGALLNLRLFPLLVEINLDGCKITDKGMHYINDVKNLSCLSLRETSVGDAGIRQLLNVPIRKLYLSSTKVGDSGLAFLAKHQLLDELELNNCGNITSNGLAQLRRLPLLEKLSLEGTQADDAGIASLAQCRRLKELKLSNSKNFTAAGIVPLQSLQSLTEISLLGTRVDDSCLTALSRLRSLKHLDLSGTQVTDAGIAVIARHMPQLTHLGLAHTAVTDAGAESLKRLNKLKTLELAKCRISPESLRRLTRSLPGLDVRTNEDPRYATLTQQLPDLVQAGEKQQNFSRH
ncbi:MAG TPA: protein kinase [Candidatus Obscuribacterales bacterium]